MKQIHADLMQFDPIARMAQAAYTQLVTELLARGRQRGHRVRRVAYELQGEPHTPSGSPRAPASWARITRSSR